MDRQDSAGDFGDKWRARWPEWNIAEVFVPAAQRPAALAWLAVMQELADAAWGGSDPTPGLAKLAWWQEEFRGWGKGAHRHPLARSLRTIPAPWAGLADTLPLLRNREAPALPAGQAVVELAQLGRAAAAVEGALFGAQAPAHVHVALMLAGHAVATQGSTGAAGWQDALRYDVASRPIRVHAAVQQLRLLAAGKGAAWQPASRGRVLWAAWHAARN